MSEIPRKFSLLLLLSSLLLFAYPASTQASVDWAGNMEPRVDRGSPVSIAPTNSAGVDITLHTYQAGVTEGAGQGANIECFLHWDGFDNVADGNWGDTAMSYVGDVGNNDLYHINVDVTSLAAGNYGYTAYCTSDGGANKTWQGDGNGEIQVETPVDPPADTPFLWDMTPLKGGTQVVAEGDTTPVTFSVIYYNQSVTETAGDSGVTCDLFWDGFDDTPDGNWGPESLPFTVDNANGSQTHSIALDVSNLPIGVYGFTSRCSTDGGTTYNWHGEFNDPSNGTLEVVTAPSGIISNLQPPAGSTTLRPPGDTNPLVFSVDYYKAGASDAPGQAAGVTCEVWSDAYDGVADNSWGAIPLTYAGDVSAGLVDRYSASIDISSWGNGIYGFTARCQDSSGLYWYNDVNPTEGGDGTIVVDTAPPPDITNLQPPTGNTTTIPLGSTDDFTFTLDFYKATVTDADANAAGADVVCEMWWDGFDDPVNGRAPDNIWEAEAMTYLEDTSQGYDRFALTIPSAGTTLPAGAYGFTARCQHDGTTYWYGDYNSPADGTLEVFSAGSIATERALWMDRDSIAWRPAYESTITNYELHYDSNGTLNVPTSVGTGIALTKGSVLGSNDYPKFPNADGYTEFTTPTLSDTQLRDILRSEIAIAGYDNTGTLVEASGMQIQGVLDAFYTVTEVETFLGADQLGVNYNGNSTQTLNLWAPTAQSVSVLYYGGTCDSTPTAHPMTFDDASGVWQYTTSNDWNYGYYRYQVSVF